MPQSLPVTMAAPVIANHYPSTWLYQYTSHAPSDVAELFSSTIFPAT